MVYRLAHDSRYSERIAVGLFVWDRGIHGEYMRPGNGGFVSQVIGGESWQLLNPPPEKNSCKNERLNFMGNTVHELPFLALPYAMIGVVGCWERIMRFLPHD